MIRTELRKWDFIDNDKEWKEWRDGLSKRDSSNYSKFMSYRSHLVKTEKRIDKLNEQLQLEKDNVRDYLSKLTDINSKIDHLRRDFNLSLSVSPWTKDNKNWYCLEHLNDVPESEKQYAPYYGWISSSLVWVYVASAIPSEDAPKVS